MGIYSEGAWDGSSVTPSNGDDVLHSDPDWHRLAAGYTDTQHQNEAEDAAAVHAGIHGSIVNLTHYRYYSESFTLDAYLGRSVEFCSWMPLLIYVKVCILQMVIYSN